MYGRNFPGGYPPNYPGSIPASGQMRPPYPYNNSEQRYRARGEDDPAYQRPSIISKADLKNLDDLMQDKQDGWAAAHGEIDYKYVKFLFYYYFLMNIFKKFIAMLFFFI